MEPEKSIWEETFAQLEERVQFFNENKLSAENILSMQIMHSVNANYVPIRTLSQIKTSLGEYKITETPVTMSLMDIYFGRDILKEEPDKLQCKFVVTPISEGEDSIVEGEINNFEPSFKWISNSVIDSDLITLDKIQPKKVERGKIPAEWRGITQLLIFNIDKQIYHKNQIDQIEKHFSLRFQKFPWIRIKRIKELYYKGKASIILRFSDEMSASFTYFNLSNTPQKEGLGLNFEVFRVIKNQIKENISKDVTLVLRRLPSSFTRQTLTTMFKKNLPIWIQELVEISGYKYTICKVKYMQDAVKLTTIFNGSKHVKDGKINIHPKSTKLWKAKEQSILAELA